MNPEHIFAGVFSVESIIAAVVFALVCLTVVIALLLSRRRRRRGQEPSRLSEHTLLEGAFALVVAGVAAWVVSLSFNSTAQEQTMADPHAAKVDITGFQWCWRFGYPASGKTVTGTCDGNHLPTMVVPIGQPVTLRISSDDVIHSWWVPALRYKMDAFPDHINTVTITFDHAGRWIGRCAEFCGQGHSTMDFYLEAVPPKQYRQWLAGAAT